MQVKMFDPQMHFTQNGPLLSLQIRMWTSFWSWPRCVTSVRPGKTQFLEPGQKSQGRSCVLLSFLLVVNFPRKSQMSSTGCNVTLVWLFYQMQALFHCRKFFHVTAKDFFFYFSSDTEFFLQLHSFAGLRRICLSWSSLHWQGIKSNR